MKTLSYAFKYLLKIRGNNLAKTASITLGLFVSSIFLTQVVYVKSYNNFIPEGENVYRLESRVNDEKGVSTLIWAPVIPALKAELPEIAAGTVVVGETIKMTFVRNEQTYPLEMAYADTGFFNVFRIPVLSGVPSEALRDPGNIFLSRKTARLIFGNTDPVGQVVTGRGDTYRIAGVFEDLPRNTHLKYDAVFALENIKKLDYYFGWGGGDSFHGYVRLVSGTDADSVARKIPETLKKYYDYKASAERGYKIDYFLNPLTRIYVGEPNVQNTLNTLTLLAFAVLFVSAMNYVLTYFSSLPVRARTMAMHKCCGAQRRDIFGIVSGETALLLGISVLLTVCLLLALQDPIRDMTGPTSGMIFSTYNLLRVAPPILAVFLLAGILPANIFSGIPVTVSFGSYRASNRLWKQLLLFVQFAGVTLMLALLVTVVRQYRMLTRMETGYDVTNTVCSAVVQEMSAQQYETTKTELLSLPFAEHVGLGINPLIGPGSGTGVRLEAGGDSTLFFTREEEIDPGYLPLMRIPLKYGRNFADGDTWSRAIVNEEFVRQLGLTGNPVGKTFYSGYGSPAEIIGVTPDFHFMSLHETIRPLLLHPVIPASDETWCGMPFLNIRLTDLSQEHLAAVTDKLKALHPDKDVHVTAYDEVIRSAYDDERLFRNMVGVGVIITLLITTIGLFSFINDEVLRRSKEIAIRKVNGATAASICRLIVSDLKYPVCSAVVAGLGLAYWESRNWLERFPYKVSLPLWIYVVCGACIAGAIYLIVVLKVRKTANENPVNSIKKE